MARTHIQLDADNVTRLQAVAAREGVSLDELVKRLIEPLETSAGSSPSQDRRHRALALVGRFSSGTRDTSTHHDRYLADAFSR